jgi:hypothetical protein
VLGLKDIQFQEDEQDVDIFEEIDKKTLFKVNMIGKYLASTEIKKIDSPIHSRKMRSIT